MSLTLQDFYSLFATDDLLIEFLVSNEIIKPVKWCNLCKKNMHIAVHRYSYRCKTKNCRKEVSILLGTFFETSKIGVKKVLEICLLVLNKVPTEGICSLTGHSSRTVVYWSHHLRMMLADMVDVTDVVVGGPGVVVEIDESKLGKRKYNRGHRVEGAWVIGGIERTTEAKVFLVEVQDRTSATIKSILERHVHPGSIVHTDCWSAYTTPCSELDLQHKTVNHSEHYVDPITGVHTNKIEGLWNGLKIFIKPRNRTREKIDEFLFFFIWDRQNKKDRWGGLIKALKEIIYVDE